MCQKQFERALSSFKWNVKNNIENFCSRKCASAARHKYIKDNNIKIKHTSPKPRARDLFKIYATSAKMRAKRVGVEFNITPEYLKTIWDKQGGVCVYTGSELLHKKYHFRHEKALRMLKGASLDRIDPSIGYIIGNVQFVCVGINLAKSDFSDFTTKEFINFIRKGRIDDEDYVKSKLASAVEELVHI